MTALIIIAPLFAEEKIWIKEMTAIPETKRIVIIVSIRESIIAPFYQKTPKPPNGAVDSAEVR